MAEVINEIKIDKKNYQCSGTLYVKERKSSRPHLYS